MRNAARERIKTLTVKQKHPRFTFKNTSYIHL